MSTLPPATLAQLSPIAAKLYLVLHALADHSQPVPIARARAIDLAHATQSSTRWCWHALRELQTHRLIQPISRSNHRANAYLLAPPHVNPTSHNNHHPAPPLRITSYQLPTTSQPQPPPPPLATLIPLPN